jgi:hypothetical protein
MQNVHRLFLAQGGPRYIDSVVQVLRPFICRSLCGELRHPKGNSCHHAITENQKRHPGRL